MLLVLPVAAYGLLWRAHRRRCPADDLRVGLLVSAVLLGLLAVGITEGLSTLGLLRRLPVTVAWLLAVAVLALIAARRGTRAPAGRYSWRADRLMLALVAPPLAVILTATGLIALAGWPNSWDGMVYHLPRVLHWLKNGSVMHYETAIPRQLFNPPAAEFMVLNIWLLGGLEQNANLVQWLSMLGSLLGVSLITAQLGGGRAAQVVSVLCSATLPMGILQASSTQNDYVTAFWLVCTCCMLLRFRSEPGSTSQAVTGGVALGLLALSKGTAYVIAPPLILALLLSRRWLSEPRTLGRVLLIGVIAVTMSTPHFLRNYAFFGAPLAPPRAAQVTSGPNRGVVNESMTPALYVSNLVRNYAMHLGTPIRSMNRALESFVADAHRRLGVGVNDRRTTFVEDRFEIGRPETTEVRATNPIQLLAITGAVLPVLLALTWRLIKARRLEISPAERLALGLCGSFLLFCLVFKWQLLHSRLHLPMFVLGAPLVGLVLDVQVIRATLLCGLMLAWSVPFLFVSGAHPLVGPDSIWVSSREDQYFRFRPSVRDGYVGASSFVREIGCDRVGLVLGWNDWEYPLWRLLSRDNALPEIDHLLLRTRGRRVLAPTDVASLCAVIVVREQFAPLVELRGRSFRLAWRSDATSPRGRVDVFVPAS